MSGEQPISAGRTTASAMLGDEDGGRRRGYRGDAHRQAELIALPGSMLTAITGNPADVDVRVVFQPIVELVTGRTVGYEALTRGPAGTALERPLDLFEHVRQAGKETVFDRACRDAALAQAAQAGAGPPLTVFVNVEPGLLTHGPQGADDDTWLEAPADLRCVIELTERALARHPAKLLHAVSLVRELNWGVALDDVGADPSSLALMAMLRPDVIKLDLRLIQQRPDRELATIIAAINAQVEDTGAMIVAEGIETEAHLRTALAFGATFGQGFFLGRPAPLPPTLPGGCEPIRFLGSDSHAAGPTPFDLVRRHQATRRADPELVAAMHEHLLAVAEGIGPAGVVLATLDPHRRFLGRLQQLVDRVALLGIVDATKVAPSADVAVPEWSMVVLAPHYAAAVVARQAGGRGDAPAELEYALTHRRDLVMACAPALVAHLEDHGPP